MTISAMRLGNPGAKDLVHHTARHFLAQDEREAWDRIPVAAERAQILVLALPRTGSKAPVPGHPVDLRWWRSPWVEFARDAHDRGYEPRYRRLLEMLGPPVGARWENQGGGRWFGDLYGFRVAIEIRPTSTQVITAFFSGIFRHEDHPGTALRAFRAFASREHCPPEPPTGVPGREKKP